MIVQTPVDLKLLTALVCLSQAQAAIFRWTRTHLPNVKDKECIVKAALELLKVAELIKPTKG